MANSKKKEEEDQPSNALMGSPNTTPGIVDNQTSFEIGRNGPGAKIGWGCFVFIAIGEAIILIVVVVADGSNLWLN